MTTQNHDEFTAWRQFSCVFTKELAEYALTVIALDCITHTATRNNAESGRSSTISHFAHVTLKNERSALDTMTQIADS